MDVAILVALIAVNALFAMAEVALLTARRSKLQKMVESGDRQAAAALELGEDPNRFLSTVQVGFNDWHLERGRGRIGPVRPSGYLARTTGRQRQHIWLAGFNPDRCHYHLRQYRARGISPQTHWSIEP